MMIKKTKAIFIAFSVLSVLAAVFGAAWSWQGSRCDADSLRNELEAEQEISSYLLSSLQREQALRLKAERIAADRNKERDKAAANAKTLQQELENARKQNPALGQCFDMPLPDVLIERLSDALYSQN